MKNLNSKEINKLMGKIYYYDKKLYGQIDSRLAELLKVQSMLEEVNDTIIKAYLSQKKGEILNDILRYTGRKDYPDYPSLED